MTHQLHTTDDLAATAGPLLADLLSSEIERSGRCVLALSGGSTPGSTLRWLADYLDEAVHDALVVTFVDERHLPLQAEGWESLPEQSNARLAYEHWFRHRMPKVIPWALPGSLGQVRERLDAEIRALGRIDVTLLGAGPDGHVASLFPGRTHDPEQAVVAVHDSPKPPAQRLSLGASWLRGAGASVLLARGADKAHVLARAWRGDPSLPLTSAGPSGPWHWVLDHAAASRIQESS